MIKLVLLLCFANITTAANYSREWQDWKKLFEHKRIIRSFQNNDEEKRFQAFEKNLKLINEHNAQFLNNQTSYKLGLNEFADYDLDELFDIFDTKLNFDQPKDIIRSFKKAKIKKDQKKNNLPNSINWASLGYLPAVQSQGAKCGSCYAFASVISFYIFNVLFKFHSNTLLLLFVKQTAAVESAYAIKNGLRNEHVQKLSEQQIVDCSTLNNGCKGGFTYYALDYVKEYGLQSSSQYPYFGNVEKIILYITGQE